MPDATPAALTEHVTFPWWVMLVALPLVLVAMLLAPSHLTHAASETLHLALAGAAAFLGLHAPVPAALKRKPAVAKLIAAAGGGGVAQGLYLLPLVTEPRLQVVLWAAIALCSWLAGMPLTVGVSGAALPAALVEPSRG